MDILGVSKIVDGITNVVGRFIPDKNKLAEVKADLEKSISNGEIELEKIKLEGAKEQAKVKLALIERGCIPAIFYIYLLILVNNSIIAPYIEAFTSVEIPSLVIDESLHKLIGWVTWGLLGKKSVDKFSPSFLKK